MVKSISFNEEEILNWILGLHCETLIELDPTYSKGNFYKNNTIARPIHKFDINPIAEGVKQANAENLPLPDQSITTMIFDPPFLATTGKSLLIDNESNKSAKRFGVYPSEQLLFQFYRNALKEFYRILKNKGILIFKCQDKISSGVQYMSHIFIINEAEKLGFYTKDMFVLLAKARMTPDWQVQNQKNARKYHSYFLVFEKSNKKVKYL